MLLKKVVYVTQFVSDQDKALDFYTKLLEFEKRVYPRATTWDVLLAKSGAPGIHRLAGNGEHEIEIDVVETRLAQDVERFENHVAAVNAAEAIEERFVEGLDTHRNAVHAEIAKELGFVQRNGGWVAFDGPFFRAEEIESLHGAQDLFPLTQV